LFSIYALCSGVTLLVAWIPYFVIFTEPWKWYLIGTGLTKSCGMKLKEALLILAISFGIWYLFFRTILAIIIHKLRSEIETNFRETLAAIQRGIKQNESKNKGPNGR
jgi:hypothetical protein